MAANDFALWTRPASSASDRFLRGTIKTTPDGRPLSRTAIVRRTSFKYPLLRIEESLTPNSPGVFREMVADHLLVRLRSPDQASALAARLAPSGASLSRPLGQRGTWLVSIPEGDIDLFDRTLEVLANTPDLVRSASPDFIVHATALLPNDTHFTKQYGLNNTGQNSGLTDADIDAPEAWQITTGAPTTRIAIIDTGIDYLHPDLAPNMWSNPGEIPGNGIDDDANGYIDDIHGWDFANDDADPMDGNGHGTHCAGVIGARGNNTTGVTGLNWQAQLIALKFLSDQGSGASSDALLALEYCVDNDIGLSNNSWGGTGYSTVFLDTLDEAATTANHLFIAAAGNSSDNADITPHYPAAYPADNVVSVAATDNNDALADFSTYGAASVDLGAPGVTIYSTLPTAKDSYGNLSGTSMAAPHVTGAAALVRSTLPDLPASTLKQLLLSTGDPLPALKAKTVSGARLNLFTLLDTVSDSAPFITVASLIDGGTPGTSGNQNGIPEPGETIDIFLTFKNPWASPLSPSALSVTASSASLSLLQIPTVNFTLTPGQSITLTAPLRIAIAPATPTPSEHTLSLTLANGTPTPWVTTLPLNVFNVRVITGTVTLDGVGIPGATVNFDASSGGTATTNASGQFTFQAYNIPYSVFASYPGALSTSPVAVNGATHATPLNFAFHTRTVSGVLRDNTTLAPVTDRRSVYLLLDTVQEDFIYTLSQYFETTAAADGSFAFTYIYGRSPTASLYVEEQSPYWRYFTTFSLNAHRTADILLGRSALAITPASLDFNITRGTTKNQSVTLTPADLTTFHMANLRLENARPESGVAIQPYPGHMKRLLAWSGPSSNTGHYLPEDRSSTLSPIALANGLYYRVNGYINRVEIYDFETGNFIAHRELPNSPTGSIPTGTDNSVPPWFPVSVAYDSSTGWLWFGGAKNQAVDGWLFAIDPTTWTLKKSFTLPLAVEQLMITKGRFYCIQRQSSDSGNKRLRELNPATGATLRTSGFDPDAIGGLRPTAYSSTARYVGSPDGVWVIFNAYYSRCHYMQLLDLTDMSSAAKVLRTRRVDFPILQDLPAGPHYPDGLHQAVFSESGTSVYLWEINYYHDTTVKPQNYAHSFREYHVGQAADTWLNFAGTDFEQYLPGSTTTPATPKTVTAIFDARRLPVGTYLADLVASNNTLTTPVVRIPVRMTVGDAPTHTPLPATVVTQPGATATLTVTSPNTTTYRWKRNGSNLNNSSTYSGVTTSTLTITGVQTAQLGSFTCTLTNDFGTTTTNAVTLTFSNFAVWIAANHPTLTGANATATADPDADGLPNLLEYALGSDPSVAASLPTLNSQTSDLKLQLTFTPKILNGLTYTIQASSDLVTWTDTVLTGLILNQPYTHTDPILLDATNPKRFLRLKVNEQSAP